MAILEEKLKFGRGQGYGNFDAMALIISTRRTTQFEPLTNSISAVLAEIRQIPSPSDPQSNSGHFEKSANGPAAKNAEQMEAF